MSSSLERSLKQLYRSLPRGSLFKFSIESESVWIEQILLPQGSRYGAGSRLLAKILECTDRAGIAVDLEADPTDRPGDPSTYDLVRWYTKFGFIKNSFTDTGVLMRREPRPVQTFEKILLNAKSQPPLSKDEFFRWRDQQILTPVLRSYRPT